MNTKHTFGTWKQGKSNPENVSSNGKLICKCYGGKMGEAYDHARLIAAAPELLAALENLRAWKHGNENVPPMHNGDEPWEWADAAIAKARGGA